ASGKKSLRMMSGLRIPKVAAKSARVNGRPISAASRLQARKCCPAVSTSVPSTSQMIAGVTMPELYARPAPRVGAHDRIGNRPPTRSPLAFARIGRQLAPGQFRDDGPQDEPRQRPAVGVVRNLHP